MTSQIKVVMTHPTDRLVEVMQRTQLRYAFATQTSEDTYTCIMPFVMCRDYLKDVCYVNYVNSGKGLGKVHGFDTSNAHLTKQDKDRCLLVLSAAPDIIKKIVDNWNFLEKTEDRLKVKPTERLVVNDEQLVIIGDKRWQESFLALSYYTFLFRWMANNLGDARGDTYEQPLVEAAKKIQHVDSIDKLNYKGFNAEQIEQYKTSLSFMSPPEKTREMIYHVHNNYGMFWLTTSYQELLDGKMA